MLLFSSVRRVVCDFSPHAMSFILARSKALKSSSVLHGCVRICGQVFLVVVWCCYHYIILSLWKYSKLYDMGALGCVRPKILFFTFMYLGFMAHSRCLAVGPSIDNIFKAKGLPNENLENKEDLCHLSICAVVRFEIRDFCSILKVLCFGKQGERNMFLKWFRSLACFETGELLTNPSICWSEISFAQWNSSSFF